MQQATLDRAEYSEREAAPLEVVPLEVVDTWRLTNLHVRLDERTLLLPSGVKLVYSSPEDGCYRPVKPVNKRSELESRLLFHQKRRETMALAFQQLKDAALGKRMQGYSWDERLLGAPAEPYDDARAALRHLKTLHARHQEQLAALEREHSSLPEVAAERAEKERRRLEKERYERIEELRAQRIADEIRSIEL